MGWDGTGSNPYGMGWELGGMEYPVPGYIILVTKTSNNHLYT
jgi:hypothetical protein